MDEKKDLNLAIKRMKQRQQALYSSSLVFDQIAIKVWFYVHIWLIIFTLILVYNFATAHPLGMKIVSVVPTDSDQLHSLSIKVLSVCRTTFTYIWSVIIGFMDMVYSGSK